MIKRLLAAFLAFLAATVFAADANTATQAELEAVKGIGPAIATRIIDERKNGNFKDWPDLVTRVKGIGETNAAKLSAGGLTVNGAAKSGAPAAAATPVKAAKATAAAPAPAPAPAPAATTKPAAPAAAAAPASSAKELKAAAKAQAKADKASAAAQKKADKAAAAASAAAGKKK